MAASSKWLKVLKAFKVSLQARISAESWFGEKSALFRWSLKFWKFKLHVEISLSTMEAEYISLSMAMKNLIHLQRILVNIRSGLDLDHNLSSTIKNIIWEDNTGALALAKLPLPRVTSRSKHFALKYHWFREFIQNPEHHMELHNIDTKSEQNPFLKFKE